MIHGALGLHLSPGQRAARGDDANDHQKYKFKENMTRNVSAENFADRYYIDPLDGAALPAPVRAVRTGLTM